MAGAHKKVSDQKRFGHLSEGLANKEYRIAGIIEQSGIFIEERSPL